LEDREDRKGGIFALRSSLKPIRESLRESQQRESLRESQRESSKRKLLPLPPQQRILRPLRPLRPLPPPDNKYNISQM